MPRGDYFEIDPLNPAAVNAAVKASPSTCAPSSTTTVADFVA